jgi:hypothetical protein
LAEDLWEDSVKLFLAHTTSEPTDTQYEIKFMECQSCLDQMAYFLFFRRRGDLPRITWVEAYKFRDSGKAREFAKAVKQTTASPSKAPTASPGNSDGEMTI